MYTSSTHRYAFINHAAQNKVEVFDSGIEDHGDHGHDEGSKMLPTTTVSAKPTHFHAGYGYNVFFNNRDGSISLVEDYQLEDGSQSFQNIKVVTSHHGAAVPFDNGTFAVTEKDLEVQGQMASLPQKVVIVNDKGNILYRPSLRVTGMHGSASFNGGTKAAFGATTGVLIVNKEGDQQLVANHDTLVKANKWIGTLTSHSKLDFIYGVAGDLGLFKVDPLADTITPLLYAADILSITIDKLGNDLVVLHKSGNVKIYNAKTAVLKTMADRCVDPVTNDEGHGKYHPTVRLSEKYVYITSPNTGEIRYFSRENLSYQGAVYVGGKPTKMVIF